VSEHSHSISLPVSLVNTFEQPRKAGLDLGAIVVTHFMQDIHNTMAKGVVLEGGNETMKFFRVIICSVLLVAFVGAASAAGPTEVFAPPDIKTTPPNARLPQEIKAFYGETGRWWGTWYGNPPGHMEAILIIKRIVDSKTAEIAYIVPDYPTWGIKALTIERTARFEKKEGKILLLIPSPAKTSFECVFDAGAFIGSIRGPHLSADIVWEPLH
jgi:hypothetical protein